MSSRSSTPSRGEGTSHGPTLASRLPRTASSVSPDCFGTSQLFSSPCLPALFLIGAQLHRSLKFRGQELFFKGKALTMTGEGSER